MKRTFHLGVVLSITGDCLVAPGGIGDVYDILNFMTADNLFTHQLPRACKECRPHLLAQYPWLAEIDDSGVNPENWREWLADQVKRYGETVEVESMPDGPHEYRDPIAELKEMAVDRPVTVIRDDGALSA